MQIVDQTGGENNDRKKKAVPGVTSTGNGKETAAGSGTYSNDEFITGGANGQGICAFLGVGAGSALTARELSRFTGCKTREITREIQRERTSGSAICASGDGFYMAADGPELARYIRAFDRRLREMQKTRIGLETAYNRMVGQECINLESDR